VARHASTISVTSLVANKNAPSIASCPAGPPGLRALNFVAAALSAVPVPLSLLPPTVARHAILSMLSRTATLTLALLIANTPGTLGLLAPRLAVLARSLVLTRSTSLPSTVVMHALLARSVSATLRLALLTARSLAGLTTVHAPSPVALAPRPRLVLS